MTEPQPTPADSRPHLLGLTRAEVEAVLDGAGRLSGAPRLGERVVRGLHHELSADLEAIPALSWRKREWLEDLFASDRLHLTSVHPASDGSARYAFRCSDGAIIETVLLPRHGRFSACVSSQAGCAVGCVFCATGKLGLRRNLSPAEIVDQVLQISAHSGQRIRDLVFMGMGEPLQNADAVLQAGRVLADSDGLQISPRRMKVSTSGLVPQIRRFARERQRMELFFSLISAVPEKRAQLMPIQRVFPFADLIDAIREYQASRDGKFVTLEYLAIRGLTLGDDDIEALRTQLAGLRYILNIIPLNPIPGSDLEAPSRDEVFSWAARARSLKVPLKIRHSFGREQFAACGQLGSTLLAES